MNHGLSDVTVARIREVFARFPEIESAVLYGSRAKGTHKPGSDIDLTLTGEKLTAKHLSDIADALDELLIPYKIDLSIRDSLRHEALIEHIARVGTIFYKKDSGQASNP